MNNKIKDFFTVPNILSYFRIVLIPVFVILYVNSKGNVAIHLAAVGTLALSGITDMLDGKIARKFNQITEWGKIIDPLADKLTQFAIIICVAMQYRLLWFVLALFVVKELTMAALALYFVKKDRRLKGAHWYGKVSTTVFYIVMLVLLITPKRIMPEPLATILILLSGICMLFAFIMYIRIYVEMSKDLKENKPNKRY